MTQRDGTSFHIGIKASLTFAFVGDLRSRSSPRPVPMIRQTMLAVGSVRAMLAETNHRRGRAHPLLAPVALDAVGSVPVALTPEKEIEV